MSFLNDPEMKEVVVEFCQESLSLCEEMEEILDEFSDNINNTALLEKYGQIVDRIMGAAKSMGANKIGRFAELGKLISYKASQSSDEDLLNIVSAMLYDTTEFIQKAITQIESDGEENVEGFNDQAFHKRLKWLAEKFSHIERASVAVGDGQGNQDQETIDNFLKNLGL